MEVRTEAVAGATDVADDAALRDGGAGGGGGARGSGGLRRADAPGERGALGRQQLRLVDELLLGRLRHRERRTLRLARGGQLLLRGDELLGHRLLLCGARANGCRLLGDRLSVRARTFTHRV